MRASQGHEGRAKDPTLDWKASHPTVGRESYAAGASGSDLCSDPGSPVWPQAGDLTSLRLWAPVFLKSTVLTSRNVFPMLSFMMWNVVTDQGHHIKWTSIICFYRQRLGEPGICQDCLRHGNTRLQRHVDWQHCLLPWLTPVASRVMLHPPFKKSLELPSKLGSPLWKVSMSFWHSWTGLKGTHFLNGKCWVGGGGGTVAMVMGEANASPEGWWEVGSKYPGFFFFLTGEGFYLQGEWFKN